MTRKRSFEVELNPAYMAEARSLYGDLGAAIRKAVPWILSEVAMARDLDELWDLFEELDDDDAMLRAFVTCELLGQASARPDIRAWLCEYLHGRQLGDGARYQLACAYSRLGFEARRSGHATDAISYARRGIETITDLPPGAVTANLYYNLGIALQGTAKLDAAIEAFDDSAEIDDLLGRREDAVRTRDHVQILRRRSTLEP
jgi:tetratricopeptide (TPR) repeat protein